MLIVVKYDFPFGAVFEIATVRLIKFRRDLWAVDYYVNQYNYTVLRETFVIYNHHKYARLSYEKFIANYGNIAYISDGRVSF
jgi:hypothetical protein